MYALLVAFAASVLVAVVLLLLLFLLSNALDSGPKGANNSSRFSERFSNSSDHNTITENRTIFAQPISLYTKNERCDRLCANRRGQFGCELNASIAFSVPARHPFDDELRAPGCGCLGFELLCDRLAQCVDGSDEWPQKCSQWNASNACSTASEFTCTSGHAAPRLLCIPKSAVCDGRDDCGDRSDELNCSQTTVDRLDTTKMSTASGVISRLSFSRIIAQNALRRSNGQSPFISGMTGGAAAHELFLVDRFNYVVRAFDTRDDTLDARDVFRVEKDEWLSDVTYSAETDTLFVASWNITAENVVIHSFARTNSNQWNERHRITFPSENWYTINLRVLPDGTLFYGKKVTNRVHRCRVHADRSLQNCTNITLPTVHNGFDVQRVGDETRLAAALANGSVALFRVETAHVEQLSLVRLADARNPLFVGDILLVLSQNGIYTAAHMFSTTGGVLQRHDHQLIALDAEFDILSLCYANGSLFVWDFISKQIYIYKNALSL